MNFIFNFRKSASFQGCMPQSDTPFRQALKSMALSNTLFPLRNIHVNQRRRGSRGSITQSNTLSGFAGCALQEYNNVKYTPTSDWILYFIRLLKLFQCVLMLHDFPGIQVSKARLKGFSMFVVKYGTWSVCHFYPFSKLQVGGEGGCAP